MRSFTPPRRGPSTGSDHCSAARSQRHSLVALLSETETRERIHLADAVHDEPIQLIAAARLRLSAMRHRLARAGSADIGERGPTVVHETERVNAILETAMDQLRLLMVALKSPDLSDGLLHAIGEVPEAPFRGAGTTVSCIGPDRLSPTSAQSNTAMRMCARRCSTFVSTPLRALALVATAQVSGAR